MQMPQLHPLQRSPFPFNFPTSCRLLSASKRRKRAGRLHCSSKEVDNGRLEIGSAEWLAKATPLQVLGLRDEDNFTLTEENIKAAFRAKVKEFHPDVYKGPGNASTIVQRVIQAYEAGGTMEGVRNLVMLVCLDHLVWSLMVESGGSRLPSGKESGCGDTIHFWEEGNKDYGLREIIMKHISQGQYIQRKSSDPFEEPECEALDIFVNELLCIGKGCLYSCVTRAPHAFAYAPDTGCARAIAQEQGEDYQVQLAVGQCPRNCIYYVTPAQRVILEELLARALKGTYYLNEASLLDSLIAHASFENNRYQGHPKRNAKYTTKWVDWF